MSDFEQEEYYVHRKGSFVGNAPMFWAKGGNGYTSYIQGAERFSENDANQLHKEDPSKWKLYKCSEVDARLHLVYDVQDDKRLGTDEPCGWSGGYAAIASMQGEAVGVVTLADDVSQPDTSGEHKGKYQNMIYSHEPLQVGAHVYTHAPDSAARIAEQAADNARLKAENETLYTTMMAAAVEIQEHWDAHCDDEGYGPANLMHRLESGIAARYGYDAKTVVNMEAEIARLTKELEEARKDAGSNAQIATRVINHLKFLNEAIKRCEKQFRDEKFGVEWHDAADDCKSDYEFTVQLVDEMDSAIRQIGGAE